MNRRLTAAVVAGLASLPCAAAFGQLAAFPGAVGFGASTTGARSGTETIYHVTNLNDSGTGSFRDAVSQPNRIIVFDVAGNVDIASPISAQSNLTILGQTAPGGGFGVYGAEVSFYGRSNDIVRYVRFRDTTLDPKGQGTGNSSGNDVNLGSTNNMIFDHDSLEFASYNNVDAAGANNLTFSNSIIANPIPSQQFNFHWEGSQGTFINNIFANSHNRSILSKGNVQFVNNSVYNYQSAFTTGNSSGNFQFDIVNNYFVAGPSTTSAGDDFYQVDTNQSAYATGNLLDGNKDGALNGSSDNGTGANVLSAPWSSTTTSLPTMSATASYAFNMNHSGDSITHDPTTFATSLGLDQVDQQVVANLASYGTSGRLYNSQTDTGLSNGGLGTIATGSKPTDTDNDGIPDAWEIAHGLNPNVADSTKLNPLGYTMIEQYANDIANSTLTSQVWTSNGGEWNTASKWSVGIPGMYDIASVQGLGSGTDGLLTISTTTPVAFQLLIGGNGSAAGEKVQVTSGNLDVQDMIAVGNTNNGTLEIDGGTVQCADVVIGNTLSGTTYNGSLVLNGGLLQTGMIVLGGGVPGAWTTGGTVTFNGGTVQALTNLTISAPVTINSGGGTVDTNGLTGSISSVISGTGALAKVGQGVLTLSGTNSYSGGTTITAGELGISGDANIGGAASTINFNGGLLQVNGTALTNLNAHNVNWSTFNGGFDIVASGNTFSVSQNLGGTGSFTKTGAGTVVLSGTSTISGGVILNGGTLSVSADANLGANGNGLTFNGGTLQVVGTTLTSTANHPLVSFTTGTFDINTAGNTFTINQQVNGTGTLTKIGPGTLVLGTRDYQGGDTYLNGGTLRVGDPLSLRYTTVHLATAGTTLDLNGINETIGGLTGNQTLDIKGTTPYIGNNNSAQTFSGVLADSLGTGSIHKIGSGTWTLTGTNTFTGPLWISSGILSVVTLNNGGVAGPLGAGTNAAANLVLDGGTLQYASTTGGGGTDHLFTLTPNGGTLDGSGASGDGFGLTNTGAIGFIGTGNRTLTLTGTETHNSFYPALGDAGVNSSTGVLMAGSGRWLWQSKLSTYTGNTVIQQGEIELYNGGFLPSGPGSGDVDLNSTGYFNTTASTAINGLDNGANGSSGVVTIGSGTLTIGNGGDGGSFGGQIIGSALTKTGAGTQILNGTNTYTGSTTINGGVLQFNIPGAIGGTGASVLITNGATAAAGYAINQAFLARINNTSSGCAALAAASANNLDFSSATGANLANVSLGAVGAESYTGTITPYASTYLLGGGGGTLTLPNVQLTGSRNVTIVGPGAVSATGLNTYTGITTISTGGTFEPALANGGSASGMGQSTNIAANLILDGGTLEGSGGTDRDFTLTTNGGSLDNSLTVNFNGPGLVAVPSNTNVTLTLTGTSTAHNLFNLSLADAGGGFVTSVTKTGTGKWTFSADGTKTYSGDTHIMAGTLEALSGDAFSHNSNMVIDAGASLDLHSDNATINGLQGSGAVYNSFTSGTHTLTIGANNGGGTWAGNINSGATLNVVKTGSGVETFTAANSYVGSTTVTGGTLNLASAGSLISTAVSVSSGATFNLSGSIPTTATLNDSGTIIIGANTSTGIRSVVVGGVTINAGGKLVLANPTLHANRTVFTMAGMTFGGSTDAWAGQIDAGGNDMVVQSGNLATITNQVKQGYNLGTWNGSNGIDSSMATANTTHLTAIGVIQNSVDGTPTGTPLYGSGSSLGTFDGTSPANADVLLKYTYIGDTNLDGKVDASDYSRIDYGYVNQLTGWYNGDFNYDGVINGSDYTLIDNAFNMQGAVLSNQIAGPNASITSEIAPATAVPEPAAVGVLVAAAMAALGRRRRLPGG